MKLLCLTLICIFWNPISAQDRKQPNISFETDYFQALDHWVVLPELDRLLLGYIYLDPKTGFTFALHAPVTINGNLWLPAPQVKRIVTKPLDSKTPKVLLVSQSKSELLRLPFKPLWLKIDNEHRFENFLAAGKRYNALGQFDLAIQVLKAATLADATHCSVYRELGFALAQCHQIDEAERVYELGLSNCSDNTQKLEMANDMTNLFYDLKRQQSFVKWWMLMKKYANSNSINPRLTDPPDDENGG